MSKAIMATDCDKADGRNWYEVTVCETFKRTFRVLAADEQGASDCMLAAMADGDADCTKGVSEYEIAGVERVGADEFVNTNESDGYYEHDTGSADEGRCPKCGARLDLSFYPRAYANADHDGWEAKCPKCGICNDELEISEEDAIIALHDNFKGK